MPYMPTSQPTPPDFRPVPAVAIVVMSTAPGACRVILAGTLGHGLTLHAAIASAIQAHTHQGSA